LAGTADPPVRDAATVVLHRVRDGVAQVLMGQRGAQAAFMPDRFVFPGGAVDAADVALARALPEAGEGLGALGVGAAPELAPALRLTAIRELWEETGLRLARRGAALADVGGDWRGFFADGVQPDPEPLRFFFRAITPPGRPRRFDARFFLAPAAAVVGDADDFSAAGDELRHLQWIDIPSARTLPLPFITEVVLSEVEALLADPGATPRPVPFFEHSPDGARFRML